jgi:SNF2 family DNA or RNA helicase
MTLTAYHAKLFAHELTKRSSAEDVDKLASALSDAQVDLNPHQIQAALFAFRSPLSKGAILADEVGLGKTIEAGILLAQRWAERRRTLLVICPANLRKQWSQELLDKFFLPSVILETKTFNEAIRAGNLNPFEQPKIIICSFQFARSKEQRKLEHQRRLKDLTAARNQRRKDLFIAQDEVEARRETVITDVEGKLKQQQELAPLFTIRWMVT